MMKRFVQLLLICTCAALFLADAAHCIAVVVRGQDQFVLTDEQFQQWVFNGNRQTIDEDSELSLSVDAVDRTCHLNDAQKEKLRLAASGDFARFKLQIDELRKQYVGKSYDQNDIGDIYGKIQPLTARYQAGLLGESSLFAKVLHRTLTPEQRKEFEAGQRERLKARHAAKVRLFVAIFEQSCPLKATQRDSLVELLLKETRPAKRSSEYDWYVVIIQAGKIPDEKLKSILDARQMEILKKSTRQAQGMELQLKRSGVLPD
jgi:hypothetical protein